MIGIRPLAVFLLAAGIGTAGTRGTAGAQCNRPTVLTAGTHDGFAFPYEAPSPSPQLVDYTSQFWVGQTTDRQFDGVATNAALIHTFEGWRGNVCGATLEIRLRGGESLLSYNDSVRLGLKGGNDPQRAWNYWVTVSRVMGNWGPGSEATLTLDLADLPTYVDMPTNILNALNDGDLELLVEDDTAVDYATLTVCTCRTLGLGVPEIDMGPLNASPSPVQPITWGRLKAGFRGDPE
jgi:hypothetical protein